jgi:hypothetical protein
LESPARK